jgi:putative peptidoglycan lipid II flippase
MTLVSRALGLVREQVRAHYLGTGMASDAFGLATTIPNLFRRLLAEGAMTAAFVPVLVEYVKGDRAEDTRRFLSSFLTLLTLLAAVVVVVGILVTPWLIETCFAREFGSVPGKVALTIELTEWMWPYLGLVTVAAALQAALNARHVFGPSAFTPVLLNLAIIGGAVGLGELLGGVEYGLVAGFLLGGVLQVAFQVPYFVKEFPVGLRPSFALGHPGTRRVVWIMVPGILGAGVYQVNVFASQLIASWLPEGSIAALQYSIRLQELVLGLFAVSVAQVVLPTLSESTAARDDEAVRDTVAYSVGVLGYVMWPSTVALILIGPEIVRLLFQFGAFGADSTDLTYRVLVFHALGLYAIATTRVVQQAFYAYQDIATPTLVAVVVMLVNVAGCLLFGMTLGLGAPGVALAGAVSAALNGLLLVVLLRRRLGRLLGRSMASRFARQLLAAGAMVLALWGLVAVWASPPVSSRALLAVWVLVACLVGGAAYVGAARLLGIDELTGLVNAARRRLRPAPRSEV